MNKPNPTTKKYVAQKALSEAKKSISMGKIQCLYIARFTKHGGYLTPLSQPNNSSKISNTSLHEVLLPQKFLPPQAKINDKLEVFVYTDSQDRPVATTQQPKAQVNQIAILKVVAHAPLGCYLDLGIDKDIFMPCKNPLSFKIGEEVGVIILLDKQSRLIAKLNIKPYLKKGKLPIHTQIQAFIFEETPLGFGCIVEGQYYGLLHKAYIPKEITINKGLHLFAYIHSYQEYSLNLTLFAPIDKEQKQLLLQSMPLSLNFASSPESIFAQFHISKKLFKRLINELVRERKITFIREKGIFERLEI